MLRSVGVPARMAVGFTQGERDGDKYVVRRLNSHAWTEVYFPGIGWVEFEPTAGQAPLSRPLPPRDPTDSITGPLTDQRIEDSFNFGGREQPLEEGLDPLALPGETPVRPPYWLALLLIFTGVPIYLGLKTTALIKMPVFVRATMERTGIEVPIWVVRWEKWVKLSPIERAFESVNFGLRHLDQAVPVHATPVERAAKLTRILPAKADEIKILLDEHQTSLYTSRTADVMQARRAAFDLRKQVLIERMRYLFLGKPTR